MFKISCSIYQFYFDQHNINITSRDFTVIKMLICVRMYMKCTPSVSLTNREIVLLLWKNYAGWSSRLLSNRSCGTLVAPAPSWNQISTHMPCSRLWSPCAVPFEVKQTSCHTDSIAVTFTEFGFSPQFISCSYRRILLSSFEFIIILLN